jgi:hypothetical protein
MGGRGEGSFAMDESNAVQLRSDAETRLSQANRLMAGKRASK